MTSSEAVQFDLAARELTLKLVYYGPASGGKATNLVALHASSEPEARGRLMTLESGDDRTLCFDFLPFGVHGDRAGIAVRIKIFSVPTLPIHGATRQLVLEGADGVAFVADSRTSAIESNAAAFLELCERLRANGTAVESVPLVIQFNKRDLPDVRSDAEIGEIAARGREPVYVASASTGEGVRETFLGLLHLSWRTLEASRAELHGARAEEVLAAAAEKLRTDASIEALLSKSMGGARRVGQLSP